MLLPPGINLFLRALSILPGFGAAEFTAVLNQIHTSEATTMKNEGGGASTPRGSGKDRGLNLPKIPPMAIMVQGVQRGFFPVVLKYRMPNPLLRSVVMRCNHCSWI